MAEPPTAERTCDGVELWHGDWAISCDLGWACETPGLPHRRHARCSVYVAEHGMPSCPWCGEPPAY